jgi:hypothetical protein
VYDIFDQGGSVLNMTETTYVEVPAADYSLKSGQRVVCRAVYSTLVLQIPYTFVTSFLFDVDGGTSLLVTSEGGAHARQLSDWRCRCRQLGIC